MRRDELSRAPVVATAAWLHDIGYSPGASARGWSPKVVSLVGHHMGVRYETEEHGLVQELD